MKPRAEATAPVVSMLVLPAELTHRQATACLGMLMHGLRAHRDPAVVVDARALTVFDSSALAVLLECRREALSENKKFEVQGLPPALAAMATLYGVDVLLPSPVAVPPQALVPPQVPVPAPAPVARP